MVDGSGRINDPVLVISVYYDDKTGRLEAECNGNFILPESHIPIINGFMQDFNNLMFHWYKGLMAITSLKMRRN